jgi:hypothetical protein
MKVFTLAGFPGYQPMAAGYQPGVYQPMATWLQPAGRQQILPQQVISTAYSQGNPQGPGLHPVLADEQPPVSCLPVRSRHSLHPRRK